VIERIAKISSKNQITVPADIRRRLGVGASDKIAFVVGKDGKIEVRRPRYDLESVLGSIKALPGESADLEVEIERATAEEIERLYRIRRRR
jgi:AbrB family looped-hinge helix DNA binding protein